MDLIREILAAVKRDQELTAADLRQRLGMEPLPPGVIE
jgi:hypothetical protein